VEESDRRTVFLEHRVSGPNTGAIGELQFKIRVTPPPVPSRVVATCFLVIRYGDQQLRYSLPLSVDFYGGEVVPDSRTVLFSGFKPDDLVGNEQRLTIRTRSRGGEMEVLDVPDWLECKNESRGPETVIRLKVVKTPPADAYHTIRIGYKSDGTTHLPVAILTYTPK
jgi:hypothetical protein